MTPDQAKKLPAGIENLQMAANHEAAMPTKFLPFEFHNNRYRLLAAAGTPLSRLTDPTFWTHIADQMKQFDMVDVVCEDATWWASLMVLSTAKNAARMELLDHKVFGAKVVEKIASQDPDNYKAEFIGGGEKWRVLRISDKEVMTKGLDTEQQAEEWIAENIAKKNAAKAGKAKAA